VKKGDRPLFHVAKKGSDPFFPSIVAVLLLVIVSMATAACGDVDVYVNTNPTTTTLPAAVDEVVTGLFVDPQPQHTVPPPVGTPGRDVAVHAQHHAAAISLRIERRQVWWR